MNTLLVVTLLSLAAPASAHPLLVERQGSLVGIVGLGSLAAANDYLASEGLGDDYEALDGGGAAVIRCEVAVYRRSNFGPNNEGYCNLLVSKRGDTSGAIGITLIGDVANNNPLVVALGALVYGNPYSWGVARINGTNGFAKLHGRTLLSITIGDSSFPSTSNPIDLDLFQVSSGKEWNTVVRAPASIERAFDPSVDAFSYDHASNLGALLDTIGFMPVQTQYIPGDFEVDAGVPQ